MSGNSAKTGGRKALFLDRDGTLMIDKVYLSDPAGVELFPGVTEGLRKALEDGWLLFLFTNQSGIGRGYYTEADALRVNQRLVELIGLGEALFTETCIAPEAPDQPMVYRKPSPRFIEEMVLKHGLDKTRCVMVGDSAADVGSGLAAGIRAVALRTGKVDPFSQEIVTKYRIPVYEDFAAYAAAEL